MSPLLRGENLSVTYGGSSRPAVSGVDFELEAGKTLGIIGESGAGKSTLALAMLGLLGGNASVSGALDFEGRDLLGLSEKEMCLLRGSGIGMIFQDPKGSLNPVMKIVDQVAEPLRFHQDMKRSEARLRAQQLLAAVSIDERVLSVAPYAHQLSGGLCQRAMIAAALACNPRLLIADEPTSSLDLTLQAQVIDLLVQRQQQTGLALVFITHDLALASTVADEIMVMSGGSAVESGPAQQVISSPRHPCTAELVSIWTDTAETDGGGIATA